jgi:serine/threonine protein kinase
MMGSTSTSAKAHVDPSTTVLCAKLAAAKKPEDIFGSLGNGTLAEQHQELKHSFNAFVKLLHPDQNPGLRDAGTHMTRLVAFRKEAETLLEGGTYGKARKPVASAVLRSRSGTYTATELYRVGEVADLFLGETEKKEKCLLKVVRQPRENDLLDFEARTLQELHRQTGRKAEVFRKYLPKLIDSFPVIEKSVNRKVNVLDFAEGYYSLAEIRDAYPDGLDSRDAVWMIRRVFEALGWIHSLGYVHGAVLPSHLLVHPIEHGARLIGWSYAVKTGQRLTAISAQCKSFYPASVMARQPVTGQLDVQLAARCAFMLLSTKDHKARSDVPKELTKFFDRCYAGKIGDGWDAYREYDEVLKKVYGKRQYRALAMPVK